MKKAAAVLIAALMTLLVSVPWAWSYFTSYVEASGGVRISLGSKTEIHEEFYDWTKHVVITSEAGSQPVYVRVKVFGGGGYPIICSSENDSWVDGNDGYWYYSDILTGGSSTPEFLVKIEGVPEDETVIDGEQFDVVVIYETTPVLYADGKPFADWSVKLDAGEGGNS